MSIEYTDLKLGRIKLGPQLFSEIEGKLTIYIKGHVFFSEDNILILEFSKILNDWILNPSDTFSYYSMDYEEGPILMFRKINLTKWEISSIWENNKKLYVESKILFNACRTFIDKIRLFLNDKVDINSIFNNRNTNGLGSASD